MHVYVFAHQDSLQLLYRSLEHFNISTGTIALSVLDLQPLPGSVAAVNMASVVPFSRSQWASQSLRVTAKEMSIVSVRGRNNTIAERFSKCVPRRSEVFLTRGSSAKVLLFFRYQMAAGDGGTETKPPLTVGGASVLC